jgi:LPXTG-motif cell wall-anchored protein
MDGVTTVRVVAGILFAIVLGIIVWRRRRKAIE